MIESKGGNNENRKGRVKDNRSKYKNVEIL